MQPAEAGPFNLSLCPCVPFVTPPYTLILATQAFMEEGPDLEGLGLERKLVKAVVYWGQLS